MKLFFILGFLIGAIHSFSQIKCNMVLTQDSCLLQTIDKKELVNLIDIKLKDNNQIQFIKHLNLKYLKIVIKNDIGFGKTGPLVLLSGKKQYYIKEITLQKVGNKLAYFLIELKSNYLITLKDNGLTSVIFCGKEEFVFPKSDTEQIKKAANCFLETEIKK